jgi:hypothetical protein
MRDRNDFNHATNNEIDDCELITQAVQGKTICEVRIDDASKSDIIFGFSDGTELILEYSWLYSWKITKTKRVTKLEQLERLCKLHTQRIIKEYKKRQKEATDER